MGSCVDVVNTCSSNGCYATCNCAAGYYIVDWGGYSNQSTGCDSWTGLPWRVLTDSTVWRWERVDENSIRIRTLNTGGNAACCRIKCCTLK